MVMQCIPVIDSAWRTDWPSIDWRILNISLALMSSTTGVSVDVHIGEPNRSVRIDGRQKCLGPSGEAGIEGNMTGARYDIVIDGTPRTYRDRKELSIEAAKFLNIKNEHSDGARPRNRQDDQHQASAIEMSRL